MKIDEAGMKKRNSIEYIEDSNEKNDNNHLQNIVCHRELKAISNSFDIDVLKELTDVIGA